jgi:hypothetical protein
LLKDVEQSPVRGRDKLPTGSKELSGLLPAHETSLDSLHG